MKKKLVLILIAAFGVVNIVAAAQDEQKLRVEIALAEPANSCNLVLRDGDLKDGDTIDFGTVSEKNLHSFTPLTKSFTIDVDCERKAKEVSLSFKDERRTQITSTNNRNTDFYFMYYDQDKKKQQYGGYYQITTSKWTAYQSNTTLVNGKDAYFSTGKEQISETTPLVHDFSGHEKYAVMIDQPTGDMDPIFRAARYIGTMTVSTIPNTFIPDAMGSTLSGEVTITLEYA